MKYLTFEDITESAQNAANNQHKELNKKQISVCVKNSQHLPAKLFWDAFIKTNGIPKPEERGFGASPDSFRYYYFQDIKPAVS